LPNPKEPVNWVKEKVTYLKRNHLLHHRNLFSLRKSNSEGYFGIALTAYIRNMRCPRTDILRRYCRKKEIINYVSTVE
jgi:hypothetical protein